MKIVKSVRRGHHWDRYVVLRASLALSSLVGMLLASGAGTHWH